MPQDIFGSLGNQLAGIEIDPDKDPSNFGDSIVYSPRHVKLEEEGPNQLAPLDEAGECHGERTFETLNAWESGWPGRGKVLRHLEKCQSCYNAFVQIYGD